MEAASVYPFLVHLRTEPDQGLPGSGRGRH